MPAVGRVGHVWREGGTLFANFYDVDPAVIDGIRRGTWLTLCDRGDRKTGLT